MKRPLYLIGLDGVGWYPLRQWIQRTHLPNLHAAIHGRARQGVCLLDNKAFMRTENSWLTFYQGVQPELAGEWAHSHYSASAYSYRENPTYAFEGPQPFFREVNCSTLIFDAPLIGAGPDIGRHPNHIEIYGWGTESNQSGASSIPAGYNSYLEASHGRHPVYGRARPITSDSSQELDHSLKQYRLPNLYQAQALDRLRDGLIEGIHKRSLIIAELLAQSEPELALCVYAEGHTAGHLFWHLSEAHPLHDPHSKTTNHLLAVFQAIDAGIGALIETFPEADFVLFSPQGMQANFIELSSSAFLPEMLMRRSHQDWMLAGDSQRCQQLDPTQHEHWKDAVAELLNPALSHLLDTPSRLADQADPLDWSPARWYQPLWPQLQAFALPSFSEGLVRLNVRGREGGTDGLAVSSYDETCKQIGDDLLQWRDVQSGRRIVAEVIRTRSTPFDQEGPLGLMPADLIVKWRDPVITNHIAHPLWGEIGPLPYFRTGAHSHQGMMIDLSKTGEFLPRSGSKLPLTAFVQAIRQRLVN